jgi:hypothetical protein
MNIEKLLESRLGIPLNYLQIVLYVLEEMSQQIGHGVDPLFARAFKRIRNHMENSCYLSPLPLLSTQEAIDMQFV